MLKLLLLKEVSAYTKQVANGYFLGAWQWKCKSYTVYASEMNFLQLQNGHLALHESLIPQFTLSVMREQSRLQRLPHLSLNETQRHVVRAGAPVQIGSTSEDTVYAHKDHFNIGLNGHVSPVTESELRHLDQQNDRCKNRDSGYGSARTKSDDDSNDNDDYTYPHKLHLLQGTSPQ
jgi:hypothetical protein